MVVKDGNIVAFGRTVDDGKYYAQLADIIVDPDHQGEHLGELVVKTLTEQLKDYHFITLTSATEKADMFYRHLGWKKSKAPLLFIRFPKNKYGCMLSLENKTLCFPNKKSQV